MELSMVSRQLLRGCNAVNSLRLRCGFLAFLSIVCIYIVNPLRGEYRALPDINDLPSYPDQLPLMKMMDGTSLSTLNDWEAKRKPELKQAMQHYTYGYLPPAYPIETTEIESRNDAFAGLATYKEIQIDIPLPSGHTETIYLALFIPNSKAAKKPVIIYLSGQANHMSTTYDRVTVRTYGGRFPAARGTWQANYVANIEYPLTRGYAVAHFCTEDLDPDVDNDTKDGLYSLLGAFVPGTSDHRLRQQISWAWGVHRIVDYLETRADIDDGKIAVNGFSRRGQASTVASALDERIDLCWNHAGGGTHSWRDGEIYDAGYMYWFNDYHLKFIGRQDRVPFDGNAMIALHAPRPLLDTGGDHPGVPGESYSTYDCHDHASAYGEMVSADTVYRLYHGVAGVVGTATGRSVPGRYGGKLYQVVDHQKGHFQDIEFWKHGLDFMDVQFYGRCSDPYTTYVYEAEEAIISGGNAADTKIHHYGSGYVSEFDAKGDSIEFRSVCPGAGDHYIGIRAACGGLSNPQRIEVKVNGTTVSDSHALTCWTDKQWFMDYRVKTSFASGNNTVRFTKQNAGALYIDRIVIYRFNSDATKGEAKR
jgi:(4-O-methyl)-D-glucuronate---lignin esterase